MAYSIAPMRDALVSEASNVHLEAFKGTMNASLGRAYARALIRWFQRGDDTIALVATDSNNRVVGYAIGAPLGYQKRFNRALFHIAAVGIVSQPWLLLQPRFLKQIERRLKNMFGLHSELTASPELPEPTMSLVGIGISEALKGRGIGGCLLQAFEAESRRLSMRSMRLSVYPDNSSARRLYEKFDWEAFDVPANQTSAMLYSKVLEDEMRLPGMPAPRAMAGRESVKKG